MGLLQGSISYARFFVRGDLPDNHFDSFTEALRLRALRPLTVDDEDDLRAGWCNVANPADLELDAEKLFLDSYLNVGLRIDRWVIPGPLFKAHFGEAERAYLLKRKKERLSKREKEELKKEVSRRLRNHVVPVSKAIDLSWHLDTGIVRFWSSAASAIEHLEVLFQDTFHLELVPESPYTTAARLDLPESVLTAIQMLQPAVYHNAA